MSKTYFISDTHFNHKNILRYEPVRIHAVAEYIVKKCGKVTVEEEEKIIQDILDHPEIKENIDWVLDWHDKMIISNWNSVVKNTDTVWFLGDLGLNNKEKIKQIVSQLNGRKRMIMGNHDNWSRKVYEDMGFEYVSKYPVVLKDFFILSHTPLYVESKMPYFWIFGHVHSNPIYTTSSENHRCVCVERQEFKPIEIKEFNDYNKGDK